MSLPIVHYNTQILRKKGAKITVFDARLADLANAMIATMHEAHGIGLAAQQVGHALQLCVVDLRTAEAEFDWNLDGAKPPLDLFMPMIIVNPELTIDPATDEYIFEEGCLSFPGIRGDIIRPDAITLKFQDQHSTPHVLKCNDLLARCIQHEYDHLQGTLFIDRMEKKVRTTLDKAVKELAQQTREPAKAS